MAQMRLLVKGAAQVVRVAAAGEKVKLKDAMSDLAIVNATQREGVSIAVNRDGTIAAVGLDSEVAGMFPGASWETVIDAHGRSVVPGLVDAHTHPVWAGDRVHEFAMKLAGASYMEVHAAGGGINFTVEHTRAASEQELLDLLLPRLRRMSSAAALCGADLVKAVQIALHSHVRVPIVVAPIVPFIGADFPANSSLKEQFSDSN
ncbi:probable imidazolonepropionase [Penaeus indicus]|uniref:probable imidazolonepropionase n=1 Tax=Penaeus indicus TaxID=29960 RepID=UPI00300D13E6